MNPSSPFRFSPLKRYKNAHYGSESPEHMVGFAAWLAWRFPQKLVKGAIMLLLAAGLALGTPACVEDTIEYTDGDTEQTDGDVVADGDSEDGDVVVDGDTADGDVVDGDNTDGDVVTDGDYDVTDGIDVECEPGDIACLDSATLGTCNDYFWQSISCENYCVQTFGEDYISYGCSEENAENPCGCEYGMIDGDYVECNPGDIACVDDATLSTCDNYFWESSSCSDICAQNYGEGYISFGCDAEASDNPCKCDYDVVVGEPVECNPGDLICVDENTLGTCDNYYWESISCADFCVEAFGSDYYSAGCNADNAENICQCEYGIVDGEMVECTLEESNCADDENANWCGDYYWQSIDCNEWCPDNNPGSVSVGCAANEENPTTPCEWIT
jgi:hypothetical protein